MASESSNLWDLTLSIGTFEGYKKVVLVGMYTTSSVMHAA
jgi:hypothetical protein